MDEAALQRFVDAQRRVYAEALEQLGRGEKTGHWIWYVFPQLAGLGRSATSERFGIRDKTEAAAYLAHPILGARLRGAVEAMLLHRNRSASQILGHPDDIKFRSCLTLFSLVASDDYDRELFRTALEVFFEGAGDPLTIDLMVGGRPQP